MEGTGDDGGKLDYLRIPIMAKYYVADGFNIQAGPSIGFVAGGDDEAKELSTSTDFGLGFGAGYELSSGLFFDARYNLGLSNISDVDGFDAKTTSLNIGLGYRF
jgi:opacity protein-like surface antigen